VETKIMANETGWIVATEIK